MAPVQHRPEGVGTASCGHWREVASTCLVKHVALVEADWLA
jgi:hypothetical protein